MLKKSRIIDGDNNTKIMEDLHLSERTFYRYLDVILANDRRSLSENVNDDEFLNQIVICRDRLLQDRHTLLEWIKDPKFKDNKLAAMSLASELAAGVLRLYLYGPGWLAERHQFQQTAFTGKGTTGARLVLERRREKIGGGGGKSEEQEQEQEEKEFEFSREEELSPSSSSPLPQYHQHRCLNNNNGKIIE
jgi:hypothetical protein